MADALVSPVVGGTMWAASATLIAVSAKKAHDTADDYTAPLMGVMGAFVLAAQMINFTIPGTGSSGHIGGGLLLAILLGPYAGFLTMASVLVLQALMFADGGLLALGCNMFNLGFVSCFVAYPLVYQSIAGRSPTRRRIAFGVVLETTLSGITNLPFTRFALLMQPIHLAIGIVEGLATAGILMFVWQARPELLRPAAPVRRSRRFSTKLVLAAFAAAAIVTAGALSWFASTHPDGLEWSVLRTSGQETTEAREAGGAWPAVDPGTTVSGLVGAAAIFVVAAGIGLGLKRKGAGIRS
jgi:cobalt/nickel transport system permease protein